MNGTIFTEIMSRLNGETLTWVSIGLVTLIVIAKIIKKRNLDSVKICSQFGLKKSLNLKLSFAPYPIQFFVLKVYYHLCSMYLKNDLQSIQPN